MDLKMPIESSAYIVAITGASGSILGIRLIEELINRNQKVMAIVSENGWKNIRYELEAADVGSIAELLINRANIKSGENLKTLFKEYDNHDFFAPPASGTSKFRAIIVVPCSMKTLSAIAHSYTDSLITRATDVALKEGKKLIIVPRETPLNQIHLQNLLEVKRAGGLIFLPVVSFYTKPKTIEDLIEFLIGKILNLLEIEHDFFPEWGKNE